ncbi:Uncharacterised protein [Mycobacterium tuberculosis]|uniref:Uncharacterized protein n=2 Tax=Mycobacterium tuberculosis TaxID=1773 RepID=Q8VK76_MYCTO|nr:hypothetical protein MT1116 [Mycobacterium tuberculosis CDC1551]AGL99579.1 hypothetical protein CFBS_1147 [Mycobacterium tuberculosis CCDC5079]AHJ41794.1 hypothetical protein HKBS1_1148 [Mycobacterium tuberculosis HKBS1]AHJ45948.1 hypothetical protein HKBT2_1151 [Mycobacterium tuberculosis BT2]AHJ50092.1 hypothetical protein HKBT1_1146 [Mycobacterium tuberculosis BT1]AHJ54234.1 hypothetical protein CFBR_1149 [Mycobacterium tuberculosis CCDC5180]AKR00749.1 hypothetical protein Mb1595_p1226 
MAPVHREIRDAVSACRVAIFTLATALGVPGQNTTNHIAM